MVDGVAQYLAKAKMAPPWEPPTNSAQSPSFDPAPFHRTFSIIEAAREKKRIEKYEAEFEAWKNKLSWKCTSHVRPDPPPPDPPFKAATAASLVTVTLRKPFRLCQQHQGERPEFVLHHTDADHPNDCERHDRKSEWLKPHDGQPLIVNLPAELRNRIYVALLDICCTRNYFEGKIRAPATTKQPPFSAVCRLIRQEFLPMWFNRSTFTIQASSHYHFESFQKWMDCISVESQSSIRSMIVQSPGGPISIKLGGRKGKRTWEIDTADMWEDDRDKVGAVVRKKVKHLAQQNQEWHLSKDVWIYIVHVCTKGKWLRAPVKAV